MNEEELVSYVVRYCKHELSEEEYRFLQRWLEEKQENRQTFREWVRTYRQGRKVGVLGWDSGGAGLGANILPSLCLAPEETSLMEGMVETSCNTDPFIG